jgi:hypothetical protein
MLFRPTHRAPSCGIDCTDPEILIVSRDTGPTVAGMVLVRRWFVVIWYALHAFVAVRQIIFLVIFIHW